MMTHCIPHGSWLGDKVNLQMKIAPYSKYHLRTFKPLFLASSVVNLALIACCEIVRATYIKFLI